MEQSPAQETAAAVRAELARRKIRPAEMAKNLGWSKSTVSRRLAGEYPFSITELVTVADYLGCPLNDLLPRTTTAA